MDDAIDSVYSEPVGGLGRPHAPHRGVLGSGSPKGARGRGLWHCGQNSTLSRRTTSPRSPRRWTTAAATAAATPHPAMASVGVSRSSSASSTRRPDFQAIKVTKDAAIPMRSQKGPGRVASGERTTEGRGCFEWEWGVGVLSGRCACVDGPRQRRTSEPARTRPPPARGLDHGDGSTRAVWTGCFLGTRRPARKGLPEKGRSD